MAGSPDYERRRFVVDKSFQYGAAFRGLLYIVAVAAIVAVPLFKLMGATRLLLIGREPGLLAAYEAVSFQTLALLLASFVLIVGIWFVTTLFRTHKVAGPIVNLTRHIHDITAGKFNGNIRLRSGDELQALSGALNDMVESLRERDQTIKAGILNRIEAARVTLQQSGSSQGAIDELQRLATAVEQAYDSPPSAADEVEDLLRS